MYCEKNNCGCNLMEDVLPCQCDKKSKTKKHFLFGIICLNCFNNIENIVNDI